MAFEKVTKSKAGGNGRMTESVRVDNVNGRISIPVAELKYIDSYTKGEADQTPNVMVEIDISGVNHQIRITPSNNENEFRVTRGRSHASVGCKALTKVQDGVYIRVSQFTYEHAGME